ncbi:MAG: hypothetical protein CMP47_16415 [Rickettsiales bacterium]|nr:hypothetical protein [Rickettsiales bacterium]
MQDIREAIRLANIIIGNQQITGRRFNELEAKIDTNARTLSQIINNQDTINRNVQALMNQLEELKKKK